MANKETRVSKSNTFEEFRQKTNEVSLHLGDNEQLSSDLSNKTYNFANTSAGNNLFTGLDDVSKSIRFEISPAHTLDNTAGYIILKDNPTVPSLFIPNATIYQGPSGTPTWSGTITAVSSERILVRNTSGEFSSVEDLNVSIESIANANVVRIIAEAYPVGIVRVYRNGIELFQDLSANGFHVVNHSGTIALTNSPNVSEFIEGSIVYQNSTSLSTQSSIESSSNWYGVVLKSSATQLLLKSWSNVNSSFSSTAQIRILGEVDTIAAIDHGALTAVDVSFGNTISLNTDTALNDDIKIFSMDIVASINELQSDVGVKENLTTTATNLVSAVNEHDAELGLITDAAMGTVATTVSGAIREHEDQIGNENITSIDSGSDTITGALNQLHTEVGSLALSSGLGSNLTTAVNALNDDLVTPGSLTSLNTSAEYVVGAINEHETELYTSGVTFTGLGSVNFQDAIEELRVDTGDVTPTNMGTTATNLTDAVKELNTELYTSGVTFTGLGSVNFQDAIEELRVDTGDVTAVNMGTTATNLTAAIKEHEDQIGNVDITSVSSTNDTITGALVQLHNEVGTLSLNTTATNLTAAINELESDLFNVQGVDKRTLASLTTVDKTSIVDAINELDGLQGNVAMGTTATTITGAIKEHDLELGTITAGAMGTAATTVSGAIAEHEGQLGTVVLSAGLGSNLTTAVNALNDDLVTAGSLNSLDTSAKYVVGAINEHETDIGNMVLTNLTATNLSAAVRELETEKVYLSSATKQVLTSQFDFKGNSNFIDDGLAGTNTFTFGSGTVLDVSNASLLLPGSSSNINIFSVAFLEVDGNLETPMGFSVDRQHVSTIADKSDVRIQWDENYADGTNATRPARAWRLQGLNDAAASHTSDIVTFYNAKDLIANNTESGINVSWDSTNENFDFDVNDFTVTLGTGPINGSFTITNLASTTFNTTLRADSVTLGTHTVGNYVATISGTANEIEVGGSGSENSAVTIGLPNAVDIGDLDVTDTTQASSSTTGALTVAGGAGIAKDLYVGGNLFVQGDQTILNTQTLTIEDTLVLAGNGLISEPSSGGFGLEVGPITSPGGVATGVTGAHSIVYNYGTNRWEADGSLILSEATLDSPTVDGISLLPSRNIDFISGAGLSTSTVLAGSDIDVTFTNIDRGSSQNIFKNIVSNAGTTTANINNDTLNLLGGTAITTSISGDTVTFTHLNYIAAGTYGQQGTEDGTYIKSIAVNAQGHVTAITADDFDDRYISDFTVHDGDGTQVVINNAKEWKFVEGTPNGATIDINWTDIEPGSDLDPLDLTFTVTNTDKGSSQAIFKNIFSNSGSTTANINNDSLSLLGGTAISSSIVGDTVTFNHSNYGTAGTYGQSGNEDGQYIKSIAVNAQGHVTAITSDDFDNRYDNYGSWTIQDGDTTAYTITSGDTLQIASGSGIVSNFTADDVLTISHADTSAVGNLSVDNSGNTFIQDIAFTFDTFGHVTGATQTSATVVIGNGTQTISAGTDLITGGSFTANQSGNSTVTINHADIGRSNSTTVQSPGHGATFTVVDSITSNARGHITAVNTKTVTLPADNNTIPNNGTLTLASSTGISGSATFTANQAGSTSVTFTNTDRGSSQNIWKNIGFGALGASGTKTANINNDTLYLLQGGGINITDGGGDIIYISHADTSSQASVNNSGRTYIQDITLDTYGHITGITSATETVVDTNTTYTAGTGMSLSGTTFNCTVVNTDTNTTYSAGTGLDLSGTTFSVESDLRGEVYYMGGGSVAMNIDCGTNQYYMDILAGTATKARITSSGNAQFAGDVTAFYSFSDERLKENIKVIDNALEKVDQLKGVTFNYKKDGRKSTGLIAQDLEKVLPEAVYEIDDMDSSADLDTVKAVRYGPVVGLLVEAIKELKDENKELRAMIEELKHINNN